MYFHSTKSEVRWNVDTHEDNFEFPTVECKPGDVCPGHLNLINNWQGEGESIVIIRRDSWDGIGQVRRIGIGRLNTPLQLVNDQCVVVNSNWQLCSNNPICAWTYSIIVQLSELYSGVRD